jgi:hypothetical protein
MFHFTQVYRGNIFVRKSKNLNRISTGNSTKANTKPTMNENKLEMIIFGSEFSISVVVDVVVVWTPSLVTHFSPVYFVFSENYVY